MLSFKKCISCLIAACTVVSGVAASAQTGFITLKGSAGDVLGVTVLLLEKDSDLKKIIPDNILYINQASVKDGKFSIDLPLLDSSLYDMYSNVLTGDYMNKTKTFYVSEQGDDSNSGESADDAFKTLDAAYDKLYCAKEIVLMGDYTLNKFPSGYAGNLTIRGDVPTRKLTIPSATGVVNLEGDLTIESCVIGGQGTIYANGYKLVIKSDVTTDNRINVYGGSASSDIQGDTSIEIYGGQYGRIFGGGNGRAVKGNTNVTVGGNVNPGMNVTDETYECYVYGGGNNGAVTGCANLNFGGDAKSDFIIGAGNESNGTASKTMVNITGGQVMNAYGGSTKAVLSGDTHIVMTGGKAEALFGGSSNANVKGNTCVDVFGGNVTRRVYTGCYNDMDYNIISATWKSDYYVEGTTALRLKPGASVVTGSDLNRGLFCGSRREAKHQDEKNFIIYLDGCQNTYSKYLGEQGIVASSHLKNYLDYTVSATTGGDVYASGSNKVHIKPDEDYYAVIGANKYAETDVVLTSASTAVEFVKDYKIKSVAGTITDTGVGAKIKFAAGNTPINIYVALYDGDNLVAFRKADVNTITGETEADLTSALVAGKEYRLAVMMWDMTLEPLTTQYNIAIKK